MGWDDLSDLEKKLFDFIKDNDFESKHWNSAEVARKLGCKEDEVYEGLANISKHMKDRVWIHYDGGLKISAE